MSGGDWAHHSTSTSTSSVRSPPINRYVPRQRNGPLSPANQNVQRVMPHHGLLINAFQIRQWGAIVYSRCMHPYPPSDLKSEGKKGATAVHRRGKCVCARSTQECKWWEAEPACWEVKPDSCWNSNPMTCRSWQINEMTWHPHPMFCSLTGSHLATRGTKKEAI